jgi:hypothetical protein
MVQRRTVELPSPLNTGRVATQPRLFSIQLSSGR